MLKFSRFVKTINEGGNVKIKTSTGEVSAGPITVGHRPTIQSHVSSALSAIHDSFHKATGKHLFGAGQKALKTGSAYSGSTKHLMNKSIPDKEFTQHKKTVGDIDVQIPKEHAAALHAHLQPGMKFGNHTVLGTAKHGSEMSAVMKHEPSGEHHQIDFEHTDYKDNEPTKAEQFSHSSDWGDTKAGIKGMHHKMLINAAGRDTHKFSITHGLRSRTDDKDPGVRDPEKVSKGLFGAKADHSKIHSFTGVADLIKNHIDSQHHQEIYDKFKSSATTKKNMDHSKAINHLRKTLGVKDSMSEELGEDNAAVHHTTVIPMVGFSPISHMGHSHDLGGAMHKLPGTKHMGISGKSDAFEPHERKKILNRQWAGHKGKTNVHIVKSGGETIGHAYHDLPKTGKKVLHILVGHDRADMAHGLKKSLEAGKIKEMNGHHFDEIHVHHPEDTNRSHGMSGTKMREAAFKGDHKEFHKHLGPMFHKKEAGEIMKKVQTSIASGTTKLKRSG
jgi:hypothetical protein